MCAKFYCNKIFNFKVMIKKPISDENLGYRSDNPGKKELGHLTHFIAIIPVLAIVRTFGAMHCFKETT